MYKSELLSLGGKMKENKKILFLQVFGIILVVIGHSGEMNANLHRWIYSFHMPLFMFISGYLLNYTNQGKIENINLKEFFWKKVKRLLIPYFIITSLAYIPKYVLNKFALRPIELTFSNYLKGFIYPWDNPIIFFWFLPTLLIIMMLVVLLIKIVKSLDIKYSIEILLVISAICTIFNKNKIEFLNIKGVINYTFFFILGIYYLENEEKIENFLFKNKNMILVLSFFILILNSLIIVENKGIYLIVAITGIIFSILLGEIYLNKNMKFLDHLNHKSYSIYLLSWFPQVFIRIISFQILKLNWIVVLPISIFLGIYFPCSIVWLVNSLNEKNKKFKFLNKVIGI